MNVLVCGSRTFDDWNLLKDKLNHFTSELDKKELVILVGDAAGADSLAQWWAYKVAKCTYKVFHPEWEKYKKAAGVMRNTEMVKEADACIAFWDGVSKGTQDAIEKARKRGIQVKVVLFGGADI